jgi:hypothetical protein
MPCVPLRLLHALLSLLQQAEHIFYSLSGRTLRDHASHKLHLQRCLLLCFLDIR